LATDSAAITRATAARSTAVTNAALSADSATVACAATAEILPALFGSATKLLA
jgi:hypothetical protein